MLFNPRRLGATLTDPEASASGSVEFFEKIAGIGIFLKRKGALLESRDFWGMRIPDLLITNKLLCLLSYISVICIALLRLMVAFPTDYPNDYLSSKVPQNVTIRFGFFLYPHFPHRRVVP